MKQISVLLVDDDEALASLLVPQLEKSHLKVHWVNSLSGARELELADFSVIVLDRNLGDGRGDDLLPRIFDSSAAHVLMLTGETSVAERLDGLKNGADDYLTKPFAVRELLARIAALARRSSVPVEPTLSEISFGSITMDRSRRSVTNHHGEVHLTRREFDVLECLLLANPDPVSVSDILAELWDDRDQKFKGSLMVILRRLAAKVRPDETIDVSPNIIGIKLGYPTAT